MLERGFGADAARMCMQYLHDYEDWQRGGLLVAGGLESQPAKWIQRCWIIDGEYAKVRREEFERRRKKG